MQTFALQCINGMRLLTKLCKLMLSQMYHIDLIQDIEDTNPLPSALKLEKKRASPDQDDAFEQLQVLKKPKRVLKYRASFFSGCTPVHDES